MKMAEKPVMLAFQNNCETINSNGIEVAKEPDEKIINNDISEAATNKLLGKSEDEPETMLLDINNVSQEDAVEDFLAGAEHKNEFNDDLLLENISSENDAIEFKTDNVIMDCPEMDKNEFFDRDEEEEEGEEEEIVEAEPEVEAETEVFSQEEECLDEENAESLNKMQIMEDVREGCSVQPSSPGHAEERLTEEVIIKPDENGFSEETPINGDNFDDDQVEKSETSKEAKDEKCNDEISDPKPDSNHNLNEESSSNESAEDNNTTTIVNNNNNNKRKIDESADANKKLRNEIQENFYSRDKLLNEFIELSECSSVEQLQIQTEQVLAEIRTLNELAREKEREWNNIIHLKKMKEELLLRMQRRKQVMLLSDRNENGDLISESQNDTYKHSSQSILKSNLTNPHKVLKSAESKKHRNILPKPTSQQFPLEMNGSLDYRQNKQRPIIDVQSIIADYRQRHPETVPRRGRRIRNPQNEGKIINFSSIALGSGAQVQHNSQNLDSNSELGILLNAMDANCSRSSGESSNPNSNEPSFKDMLVQFAKLSQSERHELIQNAIKPPPPYPEVTVHPVPTTTTVAPTNSLLHGILTKSPSKSNTKTSFSPTLARLLTAPERANSNSPTTVTMTNTVNNSNMSISEILSTSKARNEITITPVGAQFESSPGHKGKSSQADEDEAEDSADRLVIDESSEAIDARGRGDNSSDTGDEVPQCQGCNQKSALFVCAGCGNQWYCSRDCQVAAWDEHSEVCSG